MGLGSGLEKFYQFLFFAYVSGCGLPASTLKLSPPALDTCVGAITWYTVGNAFMSR
jgi:hypothetical protein